VHNKTCGIEVDLWALGIVLFQMLLGYTPYGGPSPYLTFLRIKRSFLQVKCLCFYFDAIVLFLPVGFPAVMILSLSVITPEKASFLISALYV
jgi:serine/threonine protein kinase